MTTPALPPWPSPAAFIQRLDVRPSRGLSQNFLTDQGLAARLAGDVDLPSPMTPVVEIGPGTGALTWHLARRTEHLVALELDSVLAAALADWFSALPHVSIRQADALEADFDALAAELGGPFMVAGNLPYGISTPLLTRLARFHRAVAGFHILLQREVVQKMTLAPGDRHGTPLGILLTRVYQLSAGLRVPAGVFLPPPEVESQVLVGTRRAAPLFEADDCRLLTLVSQAFARRRKMLAANLSPLFGGREKVLDALAQADISAQSRAEELTMEQWARLYLHC